MDNQQQDNGFIRGMFFKRPHQNSPEWVKGSVSIKVEEFKAWFKLNMDQEWINIDLLESKGGKLYFKLNTFEKTKVEEGEAHPADIIPF